MSYVMVLVHILSCRLFLRMRVFLILAVYNNDSSKFYLVNNIIDLIEALNFNWNIKMMLDIVTIILYY